MKIFDYILITLSVLYSFFAIYQIEKSRKETLNSEIYANIFKKIADDILSVILFVFNITPFVFYRTFCFSFGHNALQFQKKILSTQENMMNFALMLTANQDDTQNLVQYTTMKVLDNQEKFVDNINFKGWVLTVMRNIFINNYHKIVKNQMIVDQGVDLYNLDVVNDSGFDSPDGAYQIKEITKAINSLNDELRVPFLMFLSGYKYDEIADKLCVPLGTVKSRIFFARQELQKILKDFR